MFVISLSYKVPLAQVEAHMDAHKEFLDEYYGKGIFLLSGRKVPRTGGCILAQGIDREEMDRVLKHDPFYANGIADYDIIQVEPTKLDERLSFLKGN